MTDPAISDSHFAGVEERPIHEFLDEGPLLGTELSCGLSLEVGRQVEVSFGLLLRVVLDEVDVSGVAVS